MTITPYAATRHSVARHRPTRKLPDTPPFRALAYWSVFAFCAVLATGIIAAVFAGFLTAMFGAH
jgi:hypothetical protein